MPVIALGMEGELQHATRIGVMDPAVGQSTPDLVVALAGGPNHELTDAALPVYFLIRVLRRDALVVVVVSGEHYFGPRFEQWVPAKRRVIEAWKELKAAYLGGGFPRE